MDMSLISAQSDPSGPSENGFWSDLRQIAASVDPVFTQRAADDLEWLARIGVQDYDDLLRVPSDPAAPVRSREVAIWVLSRLTDVRGTGAILVALHDSLTAIQAAAAKALGDISGHLAETAKPDLRVLLGSPVEEVRRAALYALGMLGDADEIAPIVRILENLDENAILRGMAAEALADLRSETALPALRRALTDRSAEVRYWSAFALGEIGEAKDLAALAQLAKKDKGKTAEGQQVDAQASQSISHIETRATTCFLGHLCEDAFQSWKPQLEPDRLALTTTSVTSAGAIVLPDDLDDVASNHLVMISGYLLGKTVYQTRIIASFDAAVPKNKGTGGQSDA